MWRAVSQPSFYNFSQVCVYESERCRGRGGGGYWSLSGPFFSNSIRQFLELIGVNVTGEFMFLRDSF